MVRNYGGLDQEILDRFNKALKVYKKKLEDERLLAEIEQMDKEDRYRQKKRLEYERLMEKEQSNGKV